MEKLEDVKIDEVQVEPEVPERALMLAILARALMDLYLPDPTNRRCAVRWFQGENPEHIFSYKSCIEMLGLTKKQVEFIEGKIKSLG